ncbi:uncharacterized protein K02A2.6-like [Macrosteles quadrilineatus]|uniref:uncharacterized protein K02A2.6-like n=1 Tax=Macrosteles quadrilineatus TaxID=74068 RepID=UPI0023E0D359|nr:uncharacterized protein K02A2.6-like [Macrosteles quadrilineatus]
MTSKDVEALQVVGNSPQSTNRIGDVNYGCGDVPVLGQAEVRVLYKNQNLVLPLLIVEVCRKDQPILLGRNWLAKLKLDWHAVFSRSYDTTGTKSKSTVNVTTCELKQSNCEVVLPNGKLEAEVEALKKKYNAVFQGGPGEIKGVKAQVTLKDNAVPKFCKFRPVPYSLREKVEQELDRWVEDGIAYRVSSSEWATPLVTVPKTNGVRLCADFKVTLNPVLQTEHYPLPQPEDIFASLSGCTYFSVVDLTNAYQQLAVAEDSQPLLTLTTHKGLFRLRRLPFGLSSAPAIFQAVIDQVINGLPVHYDVLKPLVLTCDASPKGVSAILSHIINGEERPIAFASKTLSAMDSFSKWMEVFLMGSISTGKTIEKLRTLFSAYGLPEELVCDNDTSFTSLEFREFLRKNGVKLTFSPPYHPASNGAAERSVQEVKKNHLRPTEVEEDEIIVRKEEVGRTIEAHQQEFNRDLPILQESTSPSISRHDASPYLPRLKSDVGKPRGVQYSPSTVLRRSQRTVHKPEKLDL